MKTTQISLSPGEIDLLVRGLEGGISCYRALANGTEQRVKEYTELEVASRALLAKLKAVPVAPKEPKSEPIPSYGDHMTMADFKESCEDGGISDDDGEGNYATADLMFKKSVNIDHVVEGKVDPKYTHVVWFNK